jgi:hypothetical protein
MDDMFAVKEEKREVKRAAVLHKAIELLDKYYFLLVAIAIFGVSLSGLAFANPAESLWLFVAELLRVWVLRLGGVIIFIGLVMFGLGWKQEDAERKSTGVTTMIAGMIVAAAGGSIMLFFYLT